MRNAFFDELTKIFVKDEKVIFITGDLGYKLFDTLKEIDAERVINVGIREAAMVGFAAGLAHKGFKPFIYSITPFATLRCLEQIKIDLCYNKNKVVVVGIGGGYSYGPNGPTHFGLEDVGVLNTFPNIHILTPADPNEVVTCLRKIDSIKEPVYLRLGRNKEPCLYSNDIPENISEPTRFAEGPDGTIICNGFILAEVLKALPQLEELDIRPTVIQIRQFKPFPVVFLKKMLDKSKPVLTVEEHVAAGGLGSEVGKIILSQHENRIPFSSLTAPDCYLEQCFDRDEALVWSNLDSNSIFKKFSELVNQ